MFARWLIAASFLGMSFAVTYWGGLYARKWRQTTNETVVEGLAIPNANLDIGEVWEEKEFVWQLPIHNVTSDTIEIRKFTTSCGCTKVEPPRLTIQPGATSTVDLTIDLTHRTYGEMHLGQRPLSISVQPVTPRTRRSAGWEIHGTVRSRVTLDTSTMHFGQQPIHGQSAVTRQVMATAHVPCRRLEVTINPRIAAATVNRLGDKADRFEITISVNPDLRPGYFQADAQISVVTQDGKRELAVVLPIAGEMQSEVRMLPARVLMPPTPVGETAEAVVTLQVPLGVKVVVDHIEIDDPSLRVEPATFEGIPSGHSYRLLQKVAKAGDQTTTARFYFRKQRQKTIALIVLTVEVGSRGETEKKPVARVAEGKQP